jgi:hypothetical protein
VESARRVARWLANFARDQSPPRSHQYQYQLDRPPREEIVEELKDAAGDTIAMITRNSYGALVLNTRDLMFADVDFPRRPMPLVGLLTRLFGKPAPAADGEEGLISRVHSWCTTNAGLGLRLYRTAAGLRVVVAGRTVQPHREDAKRILVELDSDPLYRRLCEVQECFRARLTPKPWRMRNVLSDVNPPARFPFADAATENLYRQWQRRYDEAAPRFSTCELIDTYGSREVHPDLSALLSLHDSLTGIERRLPLA